MGQLPETALENSFIELDSVLFKRYLEQLDQFPVLKNDQLLDKVSGKIRLNRIKKIVYDRNEDNLEKMNSVLSSMAAHNASVFILLQGDGEKTNIHIGTHSADIENSHISFETFERSLIAGFPGLETEELFADDFRTISRKILSPDIQHIASISGVPSLKDSESDSFIQGIEKIVDGMEGREYFAIMLATPVERQQLDQVEAAYQELYTALAFMESQQLTLSENESKAMGTSVSEGITRTLTNSIGKTETVTQGSTETTSQTKTKSAVDSKRAISGAAVGAAAGATLGGVGAGAGAGAGAVLGFIGGLFSGSKSDTTSSSKNRSYSESSTITKSRAEAKSHTETITETNTLGTGKSYQYTFKNRRITYLLELIDEQLGRIRECKNHGMWNWGSYFLSQTKSSALIGADLLAGILSGESTGIERNAIINWSADSMDNGNFSNICACLAQFTHPVFDTSGVYSLNQTSPTSLVSTKELTVGMSLPQKSLPGIPVFDSVEFGRSVSTYSTKTVKKNIPVGSVYHLGRINKNLKVDLNADSLTSHLFITGSTGSGKSNTIYSLIDTLWKEYRVPFLIVEPAKGEYKNVFGGYRSVSVLGTNQSLTPILKINPFSFLESIHVTEHIDRFIEILNAIWPMYAAMPAVLKAGMEKSYENMGWDLLTSECKYGRVFPDFQDLLDVLPDILEESEYSSEMKGNYTGALVTRVQSLTNGYFRTIFQKDELESDIIFDKPCIVDLSRIGSSETKSLLMGILFMKLQEYRMSSASENNIALKHITVLEEAHNLMRRASFDQSGEGANLQGKAVEMISNSIAEMRTYGEGFIIADQAPGLLDQSVIRNTNTKVILRLPDWEDRELVGKAANLKEEQIEELARLRTGCAAVYQNDWQQAVLCQFERFNGDEEKVFQGNTDKPILQEEDPHRYYRTKLVKFYLSQENADITVDNPVKWSKVAKSYFPCIVQKIDNKEKLDIKDFAMILRIMKFNKKSEDTSFNDDDLDLILRKSFSFINTEELSLITRELIIAAIFYALKELYPNKTECIDGSIKKLKYWYKELF